MKYFWADEEGWVDYDDSENGPGTQTLSSFRRGDATRLFLSLAYRSSVRGCVQNWSWYRIYVPIFVQRGCLLIYKIIFAAFGNPRALVGPKKEKNVGAHWEHPGKRGSLVLLNFNRAASE